ncbi:MAG: acetyl-CoA carboxylase biotin carboxylase subunit [Pyrinomonadaceae bacterium]
MFRKILIANRGEIAVRIIRACRELSITPVAVYSEADATALHVRRSDEAYLIGAAPSAESYLSIERIIAAARRSGAEAIHPGYGFLAENAEFARAVEAAGIVFIGPTPEAMELMGTKTTARQAATEAGAPVVPGTIESLASFDEAREVAAHYGYPVMLKAAAGGGGKGMRLVTREADLQAALETAQSEAQGAFGDARVYLEKAIARPRHIEIQIFADTHGNIVHLGERECSIQRRHQKVVEECPSPIDDLNLRARMGAAAVAIARRANYTGAGTIEFLVSDVTHDFYFLEMNTRLQVEHPVTEMATGLDLVREQICVAAGEKLSFTQADINWIGHAIECRVYAEDPEQNFMPSPGMITRLRVPSGAWVRDDGGVYEGAEVSIYYDPLISKLAVWGRTRLQAIDRLRRALDEYEVGGIKTTLGFFRRLVRDAEFIEGKLDTGFIARFNERHSATKVDVSTFVDEQIQRDIAIIAAALAYDAKRKTSSVQHHDAEPLSKWKLAGRSALLSSRV